MTVITIVVPRCADATIFSAISVTKERMIDKRQLKRKSVERIVIKRLSFKIMYYVD